MWSILQQAVAIAGTVLPIWTQQGHESDVLSKEPKLGPIADGGSRWPEAFELARQACEKMTLEEKARFRPRTPTRCALGVS